MNARRPPHNLYGGRSGEIRTARVLERDAFERCGGAYCFSVRPASTPSHLARTFSPTVVITAIAATTIRPAISAYSSTSPPCSSLTSFFNRFFIAASLSDTHSPTPRSRALSRAAHCGTVAPSAAPVWLWAADGFIGRGRGGLYGVAQNCGVRKSCGRRGRIRRAD